MCHVAYILLLFLFLVVPVITTPVAPTAPYNLIENDSTGQNLFTPITFIVTDTVSDLVSPTPVTVTQSPTSPVMFVWLTTSNTGAVLTGELRAVSGAVFDYDDGSIANAFTIELV